jgi:UDP-N-acetylmuramyl pentapeptide phosphotransferase/UDP-N-acetylglucosamine-1-phosphate transferase
MQYIIITLVLFLLELTYFKIADKYNIIDKPNHRSSHSRITLRGGGVIFPIAVLIAFLFGYVNWMVTLAVVLVAVVSFIDDIKPLPTLPRFGCQIMAILLIASDLQLFHQAFWVLPLLMVFFIGWINAFNFMDGINGITVLYALVAISSFSVLAVNESSFPLLITMGLSCLVFGYFNVRHKAKTFAGDVGSISMAVFLGYFLFKTIFYTGQIGYMLFFSIYGIDAIITILYRIKKRENILEAHRSHLYQYLANEWGYSHIVVSVLYAFLQLLVNGIVIYLDKQGELSIFVSLLILAVLTFVYLVVRVLVVRKSILKNEKSLGNS